MDRKAGVSMKAKEYLQQLEKLDALLENKLAEHRRWQEIAMSYGVSFSANERVQSSGSKQKMADAVCEYVDIDQDTLACLRDQRKEIISTIEKLNAIEYKLLHMRYVLHRTPTEVAETLGKTYNWFTTVHGRALQHVQEIIDRRGES